MLNYQNNTKCPYFRHPLEGCEQSFICLTIRPFHLILINCFCVLSSQIFEQIRDCQETACFLVVHIKRFQFKELKIKSSKSYIALTFLRLIICQLWTSSMFCCLRLSLILILKTALSLSWRVEVGEFSKTDERSV